MNWPLLKNSLLVSGLTSLGSVALGFVAALWLAGLEARWRKRLLVAAVLALVLPPFLVTNCWLDLLGATGAWGRWVPLKIYSLSGAAWILTLLTWPITLLLTLAAWSRVEPAQLESDPRLCGGALIRWLLWPMARGAVGQAAVITCVLALNNFAVPTILQVKVFPAEVWVRFSTKLDAGEALAAGWPLIVVPALLLLYWCRADVAWPHSEGAASARVLRRQLGSGWVWFSGAVTMAALVLSVGVPLGELVSSAGTWTELPKLFHAAPDPIWNSFWYAALAATVCVVVGFMSWRLPVGPILWLPFLVPGVLLGVGLTQTLNGKALQFLYGSAAVVVLALAIRYLALGWHGVARARRSVDRNLTEAARLDGASGWALLRHVHWPQLAPQVGAAWYVTYLLCLWDVETLVLICPPGGETLALRVFNLLHYGHTAQVNAHCVTLLALAAVPLLAWSTAQWFVDRRR